MRGLCGDVVVRKGECLARGSKSERERSESEFLEIYSFFEIYMILYSSKEMRGCGSRIKKRAPPWEERNF